ncbi:MAG: hypothetical protein PHD13_02115 [Methanocellales archaeon]|nr:hypothetical protein [Methanocellales archaeon]MDD3291071.1 hypothetical protein [Methanocellales archaeon]MDD5234956.1 hypothetical protein [Methanocellales archaeon]MDD5484673.1 hypothetical protein [Methanocellales archaeon]
MTSYKPHEIEKALNKKGFKENGSHHKKYTLYVGRKRTSIYTFISHGSKTEYNDSLLSKMKNHLCLSKQELELLIDCPLDKDGYTKLLAEKGRI